MRRALLGALVFLAGCACPEKRSTQLIREARAHSVPRPPLPNSRCVTTCGLRADFDREDCDRLTEGEGRALHYLSSVVPEFRPGYMACAALNGYHLSIESKRDKGCEPDGWRDPWKRCVTGLTYYEQHQIFVQDKDFDHDSLAHEIAHVLDHQFGTEQGFEHCGWEARGIKGALLLSTGQWDQSDENCD